MPLSSCSNLQLQFFWCLFWEFGIESTNNPQADILLYYTHFEITGGPCNLIGSNWCELFTNRTIFALNGIFFPGNEEATLKTKRPISCLKLPIKFQKIERQRVSTFFATFVSKTLTFSPQRMDGFNFRPAQYCINKMFELTKSCIWVILKLMW